MMRDTMGYTRSRLNNSWIVSQEIGSELVAKVGDGVVAEAEFQYKVIGSPGKVQWGNQ